MERTEFERIIASKDNTIGELEAQIAALNIQYDVDQVEAANAQRPIEQQKRATQAAYNALPQESVTPDSSAEEKKNG